tara:strand:- start:55 stop:993 length:939 start_codon:yes stop_codon:yes gene_type:complete
MTLSKNRANVTDWMLDIWANAEKDVGAGVVGESMKEATQPRYVGQWPQKENEETAGEETANEEPVSASIDSDIVDGKKRSETHYGKNGVIIKQVIYNLDGKTVARERVYTDGEVTSWNEIEYNKNGSIALETNVVENEYHGVQKEYDKHGNIITTIEYEKGYAKGEWVEYNEQGNVEGITILAGDGAGTKDPISNRSRVIRLNERITSKIFKDNANSSKRRTGSKGTKISSHGYYPDGGLKESRVLDQGGNTIFTDYHKDGKIKRRLVRTPDLDMIEEYYSPEELASRRKRDQRLLDKGFITQERFDEKYNK